MTASDVARSLGLSRATVGFVLNRTPGQTISATTRDRVLAEAERLGYRPHAAAQALARGRSNVALFVLPDWPIGFAMRRSLEEAGEALDRVGYALVAQTRRPGSRQRPLWETLQPDVVLGMLPFPDDELAALRAAGIRHVIPERSDLAPDDLPGLTAGARLQVRYLHDAGHRVLAYAASNDGRVSSLQDARLAAVRRECSILGLASPDVRPVDPDDGSAGEAVASWRSGGVTGVIGHDDETAAAVVGAALRAGVAVPGELAVIGHDDSPLARLLVPALTSVRLDWASLGGYVAKLALHTIGGAGGAAPPAPAEAGAQVIPREST